MNQNQSQSQSNTILWYNLRPETQEAINKAIKEKREMILDDGRICQLESFGENNNTIICKTGRVFKDTVSIPLTNLLDKKFNLQYGGASNTVKRGGSKRRRTKRLRKNKKIGRTRRHKI